MADHTIPAHAERIDLMTVFKTRRRPSHFAKGVEAVVSYVECPGCTSEHDDPGVFKTITCDCGLSMQCTGASAVIWRDETAAAEAAE